MRTWPPFTLEKASINYAYRPACPLPPEPMLSALLRRMPGLESAEIHQLVNCPESFTPDMRCLMGETAGISGYYVLAGMNSSGLSFAGGAGK